MPTEHPYPTFPALLTFFTSTSLFPQHHDIELQFLMAPKRTTERIEREPFLAALWSTPAAEMSGVSVISPSINIVKVINDIVSGRVVHQTKGIYYRTKQTYGSSLTSFGHSAQSLTSCCLAQRYRHLSAISIRQDRDPLLSSFIASKRSTPGVAIEGVVFELGSSTFKEVVPVEASLMLTLARGVLTNILFQLIVFPRLMALLLQHFICLVVLALASVCRPYIPRRGVLDALYRDFVTLQVIRNIKHRS
jgi:hypothetical protein